VTRADLAPAVQAVQAAHAALAFSVSHPDTAAAWAPGGSLLLLACAGEHELRWLLADAARLGRQAVPFHEPDLGGALTAVAVYEAPKLCRRYPLALKEISHAHA
jgi:hypothetical protein